MAGTIQPVHYRLGNVSSCYEIENSGNLCLYLNFLHFNHHHELAPHFTFAMTFPFMLDILVVADSAASLAALHALVLSSGYMARTAQSGREALALVQDNEPDLVLLDMQNPDLDGFELTRRLRLLNADHLMKVLMVSPSHGDEHVIQALKCGADDFLPSPVNGALLAAKLRHLAGCQRLHSSFARLAQRHLDIIDNIGDAVITLDENGHIEDMNSTAHALFDPRPHAEHAFPLPEGNCLSLLGQPLEVLLGQRECRVRRADGGLLPVDVNFKEWREKGRVRYTLVLRDQSAQRAVDLMQNEFLATVSHELRTPLTSLLGSLGLLAGGAAGVLPPAATQLAAVAERNGKRLSRLIDDILDLTHLRSDQFVLHSRQQPVGLLLQEALAASRPYASSLNVQIETDGIEAHGCVELRLDTDRFLQVIGNLLSNAIKHSPAGEVVQLRLVVTPSAARISVIDRGPGISAAFRSQLFKLFSKAEGGNHGGPPSTGLGLYISRLLVERMGGEIAADPAAAPQNVGASFSVAFPLPPAF
jgi:signal transduction histidine kinase/DNA-binding NarL/FixJ family response regulator